MESQSKFVTGSVRPTGVRLQHDNIVENNICRPGRVYCNRQKGDRRVLVPPSPRNTSSITFRSAAIVVVSQNNIFFISKHNCSGHVLYYPLTLLLLE